MHNLTLDLGITLDETPKPPQEEMVKVGKNSYPVNFVAFYRAYPKERQEGYILPFRSWKRLQEKGSLPSLQVLLESITKWKNTGKWSRGFVPMMSTFLNQHQWEAEVVDGDLQAEKTRQAQEARKAAFFDTQQSMNRELLESKTNEASFYLYNLAKLAPEIPIEAATPVIEYYVYEDVTLCCPDKSHLGLTMMVVDAVRDLASLRYKSHPVDAANVGTTITEFFNIVLLIITGRYGDALSIEALKKLQFSSAELRIIPKLLSVVLEKDALMRYHARFKMKPYINVNDWLLFFTHADLQHELFFTQTHTAIL